MGEAESIQYIGEHLLPGLVGHGLVILAFISSLVAIVSGLLAEKQESSSWRALMRGSFVTHFIAVASIIALILFMMMSYYYEYKYVQSHVSDTLPMQYVLSAFWEGQEGSFLLWMFWNGVLGLVVLFRDKKWGNIVIPVVALCQAILLTMIMGIYVHIGDYVGRIGSSPFVLLRDAMDAPIFSNPNYLESIQGLGLNVLLQNYWNIIHPPILFLGFASVIIPFGYAIASLYRGDYMSWLQPARQWALFSGFVLGFGICLGGAWAYEALTFGGYWAWDPVENMSLVPWLFIVAGLHANSIVLSTRQSLKSTYIFYLIAFITVLYSTFLTRSGVLQDTSVHAFTQLGLETQLIFLISVFSLLSIGMYFYRRKDIPVPAKEEPLESREFWMYLGALVIVISALLITYGTSLPVINKLVQFFDPAFEDMVIDDQVAHFNKHQLWIGVLLGLLTAATQFLRFRGGGWQSQKNKILLQIGGSAVVAGILTFASTYIINANAWQYQLLLFASWYAIIGNSLAFFTTGKRNAIFLGSTLSHVGVGVLLIGALYTGLNEKIISSNLFAQSGLSDVENEVLKKNLILLKGEPMFMEDYMVTYESDSMHHQYRHFFIDVKKVGEDMMTVKDSFTLMPNVIYTQDFTDIEALNPAIKRGLTSDIFTRITRLPLAMMDLQMAATMDDSLDYVKYTSYLGDTLVTDNYNIVPSKLAVDTDRPEYDYKEGDYPLGVEFRVYDKKRDSTYVLNPFLFLRGPLVYNMPVEEENLSMKIKLRDTIIQDILQDDDELDYETVSMTRGETINYKDFQITFKGIDTQPEHPGYNEEKDDLAVAALLEIEDAQGNISLLKPVYIIRNMSANGIRDINLLNGIYARVKSIDPNTEKFFIEIAKGETLLNRRIQYEVADEVPKSNFIVFQATVIHGINLVWAGMLLTLSGFLITLVIRARQKRKARR